MARWVKFTQDYDHKVASRAVIAYKKDLVAYVPESILKVLPKSVYTDVDKPKASERIEVRDRNEEELVERMNKDDEDEK